MEDGLFIERLLPLAWTPNALASAQEIADWMQGNLLLLKALAGLETPTREAEGEPHSAELQRLETKIDLTLTLVAELLRRQTPLPAQTPVTVGSAQISWQAADIVPGTRGVVALYLSPHLPWPLQLPVEITACGEGRVHARLLHLSEDVQHWLDRTLFRHHRRELQTRRR